MTCLHLSGKELFSFPLSSMFCDFSKKINPFSFKKYAYERQKFLNLAQKIISDSGPMSSISSKP
jgi:hypothetical protein